MTYLIVYHFVVTNAVSTGIIEAFNSLRGNFVHINLLKYGEVLFDLPVAVRTAQLLVELPDIWLGARTLLMIHRPWGINGKECLTIERQIGIFIIIIYYKYMHFPQIQDSTYRGF